MKNSKLVIFIHKYGMNFSVALYVLLLTHIGIYVNKLDFWLLFFCFCLNMYFIFHKGMVYMLSKQFEKDMLKEVVKQQIRDHEEKNKNKMN